jgi:cytochrome c oxidase assembly factor CtaG
MSGALAILLPLGLAVLCYARGFRRLAAGAGSFALGGRGRAIAFAAALVVILAALLGPLDDWADASFAAHMGQHLLLIVVAAPLLAVSRTPIVMLSGLDMRTRRALAFFATRSGWNACVRAVTRPLSAWAIFTGIFLLWHLPAAFHWAQRHEAAHIAEHLTLLGSSWVFWSVALVPVRHHLGRGGSALFVVTAAMVLDLPSAVMIFSPRALYLSSQALALPWGITALEDQEVAGLLMWVPGSLVFYSIAIWLFAQWLAPANKTQILARDLLHNESVTS